MNRPVKIDQITFTRFIAAIPIVVYRFGGDVFPFITSRILA
ncbi:MAG: hypothetical protein AABZ39_12955 [Spirochaetota bacterium]